MYAVNVKPMCSGINTCVRFLVDPPSCVQSVAREHNSSLYGGDVESNIE